jgi:hypothetical protein
MPATIQGRINNVRKALEEYKRYMAENDENSAGRILVNCWSDIEWCLQQLAKSKNVEVDGEAHDDGSHTFHQNLINAFSQQPLFKAFPSLSSASIRLIMEDSKVVRNKWSRGDINAAMKDMSMMYNGLPVILSALEEARKTAGLK